MGKADINVNIWLSEKKRFANLFNGIHYKGKQVILPEDLEEVSPVASVSVKNRAGKTRNMKKYRDIIMKWKNHTMLVLLANESQDQIHYAMPQKVMIYDGMDYEEQIRSRWKQLMEQRKQTQKSGQPLERLTAAEYLSHFRKSDRLTPIISLVFYYGSEPWDGPLDLYDMFHLEGTEEEKAVLEKYLPNYKINLIDAERMKDSEIECFSDDLQVILTMLKYRHKKTELNEYINKNNTYFQNVDYETSQVIKTFLNLKHIPGEADGKETINMCEAIQEMYDDGVKAGMEAGMEKKLIELIFKKLKKGNTVKEISDMLEEDVVTIQKICDVIQACDSTTYTIEDIYKQLHK